MPALIAYIVPLTLPIAVTLITLETPPHIVLGFGGIIFSLALVFLGRAGNRSFAESFRLGVDNAHLAAGLSEARARLSGCRGDARAFIVRRNNFET